jgi:hypothetical protein
MGSLHQLVLMAPGVWDYGWAGTTDQPLPATRLHLVLPDSPVTLCGWPTKGFATFRDSAFEPKCTDCLAELDVAATGT